MAAQNCHNCVFSVCDQEAWLRLMWRGEPILPMCANHPQWPGQMHEVPGVPCRNHRPRPPAPPGDVRLIPLAEGFYAYVDAADYEWLSRWQWHMASGGNPARSGKGRTIFMHREIMQPPPGMVVDHADGNKANNCRFNLRVCTRRENQGNMQKQHGARSRFKGVSYDKRRGKYFAQCEFRGEHRWLGFFDDEVEAARAYDRAAVEECGAFARVNFPQEWPLERRRELYAKYQATLKVAGQRDTRKGKANGNQKKAKPGRRPHRARRKTSKLPQKPPTPRSRRNHRRRPEQGRRMNADGR